VVSFGQLQRMGYSPSTVSRRVKVGGLHRLARGVYAVGHTNLPFGGRCVAALLCVPGSVLSHRAAAVVWGLLDDRGESVDVTVARGVKPRADVRAHRVRALDACDQTRHAFGDVPFPVTTVARTLLDLAETCTARTLRRAAAQAFVLRLTDEPALRAQLARANGRRGAKPLTKLLDDGVAATRSELERRLLELVRGSGLPEPAVNEGVRTARETLEVDLLFRHERVVVEADGARYHDHLIARQSDAERDALLTAAGYRVLRVDWRDVTQRPSATARRLRSMLGLAGSAGPASPPGRTSAASDASSRPGAD
jgi:very-short-patch-repair endonuclease